MNPYPGLVVTTKLNNQCAQVGPLLLVAETRVHTPKDVWGPGDLGRIPNIAFSFSLLFSLTKCPEDSAPLAQLTSDPLPHRLT